MLAVRFGEDAALAADLVQRVSVVAHLRELIGRDFQLSGSLFDERPGAAGTRALHQHLLALAEAITVKENRLHVFAADFADEAHVGMNFFNSRCDGYDFLNDLPSN